MIRDYRDDRWNERRNRYQQDQYSNWQNSNQQKDENRNYGGYMGSPGSNYAAGSFSGAAYGRGLTEDNYRAYNNTGNQERNFASNYNAAYGDQWNRNTYENREDYGSNRRANYIPDNDENRRNTSDNRNRGYGDRDTAANFGYGGHYGAGGSYGSFGGPASSRINVPDQRTQDRRGAYSSDFGYQGSEQDYRGSHTERLTGGHKGKGPRGYHRSDERIWEDVNDQLSDDAYVDASGIEVNIENGTVILNGHVQDRKAKRRAEEIAESIRGVTNVENRLRIGEGMMENAANAFTSGLGDVTVGHNRGRR
jgi:osmotically-inducible protein OsmY